MKSSSLPLPSLLGLPECPVDGCDGFLIPTRKDGRFRVHRNVLINVPRGFVIPRCSNCRQDHLSSDLETALTALLEDEYQRHATMIAAILDKYRQREAR